MAKQLSDFNRYHKNPRKISDQELKDMESWMQELGDISGIIVDLNSNEVIGGNQRSKILQQATIHINQIYEQPEEDGTVARGYVKWKNRSFNYREVRWTKKQCERANIIANKAGGRWDFEILASDQWQTSELLDLGFGKEDLPFIANEKKEIIEDNFRPEPPEEPISRPGDIYELNQHRLHCNDSTSPKALKILMNGEKARLVFTDPPYGVSYDGAKMADAKAWEMIRNDELRGDGLFKFLQLAFDAANQVTIDNPALYTCYASRNHIIFETALNDAGWVVKQQIIWSKGHVMGRSDYHWCHEPILYCCKAEKNSVWFGDRTQRTTLIDSTKTELKKMTKDDLLEMIETIREESDVWREKRDAGINYEHPTQKPIALAGRPIINNTLEGEIVLDPFGGAGFVLLAAEQTGRRGFLQELDPKYVDVIITRWVRFMTREGKPIKITKNGTELNQAEIDAYTNRKKKQKSKANKG